MAFKTLEKTVAGTSKRDRIQVEKSLNEVAVVMVKEPKLRGVFVDAAQAISAEANTNATVAQLEANNMRRVFSVLRQAAAECLTAEDLGQSRQLLAVLRKQQRLLGLKLPGNRAFVYPAWQFSRNGELFPEMPAVLKAADEAHLEPLDLHLLVTSIAREHEVSPSDWLWQEPLDALLGIVGASFAHGS